MFYFFGPLMQMYWTTYIRFTHTKVRHNKVRCWLLWLAEQNDKLIKQLVHSLIIEKQQTKSVTRGTAPKTPQDGALPNPHYFGSRHIIVSNKRILAFQILTCLNYTTIFYIQFDHKCVWLKSLMKCLFHKKKKRKTQIQIISGLAKWINSIQ